MTEACKLLTPLPYFHHYETCDDEESSGSEDDEIRNTDSVENTNFNGPSVSSICIGTKNNRKRVMQNATSYNNSNSPVLPCEEFSSESAFDKIPYQTDDVEMAYNNCLKSPTNNDYYNHHSPAAIGVIEYKSFSRNEDYHTNNYNYGNFSQSSEMKIDHKSNFPTELRMHLTSILSTILVRFKLDLFYFIRFYFILYMFLSVLYSIFILLIDILTLCFFSSQCYFPYLLTFISI